MSEFPFRKGDLVQCPPLNDRWSSYGRVEEIDQSAVFFKSHDGRGFWVKREHLQPITQQEFETAVLLET
jgi:hypothetical protein